ncbi:MAG: ACP S-malonyltransferase [Planctomycetes bacterium]|nr:ACP S-malonyltransferase [Planctomycetota bacterium]MCB9903988.1 ACP S-malonyltransferase [Planctomycetota bacterium]
MQRGILFPGQGAQFEGMGRDWADAFPVAKATFAEADDVLGFSLTEKIWSSGDDVNRTDVAQPGIYTVGVAIVRVLRERGLDTKAAPMTAGLSLGEYTALWCAGGIDFADGLRLVRLRGEAMQDASEQIPSGMLSLMGADEEQAIKIAAVGSAHGICAVANLNAPGQIILSGEHAALEAAAAAAPEHGVRRTRPLVVAGGFHSECMRPAADRLKAALAEVDIRTPEIAFVSNVTGGPTADPSTIRDQLAQQVCAPVRWEQSMRWALAQGIHSFLEPGPGEVLAGIMRKIDPEADVASAATPQKLED